jgi:hypothetical protein
MPVVGVSAHVSAFTMELRRMTGTENPPRKYHHGFLHELFLVLASELGFNVNDLRYAEQRLNEEGTGFLLSALPALGNAFDRALSSGRLVLPTHFKRKWTDSVIPAFGGAHFLRVFNRDGSLRQDADVVSVDAIRQLCFFVYKVNLPYDESKNAAVIEQFLADERDLVEINQSLLTKEDEVLNTCNLLVANIFDDFDRSDLVYKHGPGVTSNVPQLEKFESRLTPDLPVYEYHSEDFFFNENETVWSSDRYPIRTTESYFKNLNSAQVILVPKDARGPRLISCEPFENQYIQQGIMSYLVNKLERHPLTRGQVNFTDQGVNQKLVLQHSCLSGKMATLDLRRASDRNSLSLFCRLFSGNLDLFRSILSCRSSKTRLPNGDYVTLQKFAPMGSALCFPVMAVAIFLLLYVHFVRLGLSPRQARESIYVYGDDLIVPIEYSDYVKNILIEYGFLVNEGKSFCGSIFFDRGLFYKKEGSRFLESCGVDAFDNTIVSPVRLRALLYKKVESDDDYTSELVSLLETANLLSSKKSLRRTSSFMYNYIENHLGSKLPWGKEDSPFLCKYYPGNSDELAEANFCEPGLVWKTLNNLNDFPLGSGLIVHSVKSEKRTVSTSLYGHLTRVHRSIGDSLLPKEGSGEFFRNEVRPPTPFGAFTVPRRISLRKRCVSHYELSSDTYYRNVKSEVNNDFVFNKTVGTRFRSLDGNIQEIPEIGRSKRLISRAL